MHYVIAGHGTSVSGERLPVVLRKGFIQCSKDTLFGLGPQQGIYFGPGAHLGSGRAIAFRAEVPDPKQMSYPVPTTPGTLRSSGVE